jgi:tetratricopeptide (TPR) repeat protein
LDITIYIIFVFFLAFVFVGGYFIYTSFLGPKKLSEVQKLMDMGRIKEAIGMLSKMVERDDRDMNVRYKLAQCYQKMNDHQAAILEFRQCIKINRFTPDVPEIHLHRSLAESYIQINNKNEARNEYLLLTTLQPDNFDNFFQVGKLYHGAGVYAKAVNFFSKSSALNGSHAESWNLLGQSHYHLGSYNDAKNALTRAVQLKADLRVARYYLGLTLRYTGDLEWAMKELENAEKDDRIKDRVFLAKGLTLLDQENYPAAITELQKGLKYAQPTTETSVQLRYLLGIAAEKNRDIALALESWDKVEKIKPGYRDVREKLRQFADFRTDDVIKDLLIANAVQFEEMCRKMISNMGYQIMSMSMLSDSKLLSVASIDDAMKMGARNKYTLFIVQRDMTPILENHIRDILQKMKENNAGNAIVMTTGEITPGALNFAAARPLNLYDSLKMAEALKTFAK